MTQICAEVFEQLQHVTWMNPKSQSYILDTGHKNLRKRIIHALELCLLQFSRISQFSYNIEENNFTI
jgi:hypothetical protein